MEKFIKEINNEISGSLDGLADIMLRADADEWAFYLDYSNKDVMNAVLVFQHVLTNVGFKAGRIDVEKASEFGKRLYALINDMTGIDTRKQM